MGRFFHVEIKISLDVFAAISTFLLLALQYQEQRREQKRLSRWDAVNERLEFLTNRFRRKEEQ